MQFANTFTFGDVLKISAMVGSLIVGWFVFKQWMSVKLAEMQMTLNMHAEALRENAVKMNNLESAHIQLVAQVQRLVGQMEILTRQRLT